MRGLFIVFIFVVASSAFIKSILFWVWIWQIKEYRLDRFLAEYAPLQNWFVFGLGQGERNSKNQSGPLKQWALPFFLSL